VGDFKNISEYYSVAHLQEPNAMSCSNLFAIAVAKKFLNLKNCKRSGSPATFVF